MLAFLRRHATSATALTFLTILIALAAWLRPDPLGFQEPPVTTTVGTQTTQPLLRTEVRFVQVWDPLTRKLNPAFRVKERDTANSCQESVASEDVEALRCFGEKSIIYDPCWRNLTDEAACPTTPWDTEIYLVKLAPKATEGVNWDRPSRVILPWGLELENGQRCLFLPGATSVLAGGRLNYQCGKDDTFIVGEPDKSDKVWQVQFLESSTAKESVPVQVRRVWV
jgi:hypothetical protein